MALETGTYIDDLVATNPASGDELHTTDDHLRLIKAVLKASFPGLDDALLNSAGNVLLGKVPNLPASRTTSGTFSTARIPNLNASKTTAGRFHVDRIAWTGSQAAYDALTPDADTLYLITS